MIIVNRRSSDWLALAGVGITIALHLGLQGSGPNAYFIVGACLFWAGFIAVRATRDPGVFRRWGFRADNLLPASAIPAALFLVAAAGMAIYAALQGTLRFPLHALLLLLLYPAWGLVQQFLALAIVVSELERIPSVGRRPALLIIIGAALFASVHAYDGWLVVATFLLELVIVPLYLAQRNLWPLALLHGWLGAFFYLWVLGRDMWVENFG